MGGQVFNDALARNGLAASKDLIEYLSERSGCPTGEDTLERLRPGLTYADDLRVAEGRTTTDFHRLLIPAREKRRL